MFKMQISTQADNHKERKNVAHLFKMFTSVHLFTNVAHIWKDIRHKNDQ